MSSCLNFINTHFRNWKGWCNLANFDKKKKTKKWKKSVRDSLLQQLDSKGAKVECYVDLVDDYMDLWEIKETLLADIAERGVVYTDVSSVGVEMQKNNPSTKEVVNISRQMLAILKQMDLSTSSIETADDYEL